MKYVWGGKWYWGTEVDMGEGVDFYLADSGHVGSFKEAVQKKR